MTKINEATRAHIRKAVQEAERNTTGEFACVLAESSARYVMFPLLWAALAALILPFINSVSIYMGHIAPVITFPLQSVIFVLLAGLFVLTPLRNKVTPRAVQIQNCRRTALEQFFTRSLYETTDRTGILFYVSIEERYVDIIADKGIDAKVDTATFEAIISAFVADIRKDEVEKGFTQAIQACRSLLGQHFPAGPGHKNQIPDELVELPPAHHLS